jgi:uncharacterized protein
VLHEKGCDSIAALRFSGAIFLEIAMSRAKSRKPGAPRTIDRRFARFGLRIARSKIHGAGVFALEEIPPGVKVIEYSGERVTVREATVRSRRWERRGAREAIYLAYVSRECVIDGARGGCGAELINHSCAPNLGGRVRRSRLWFISRQRIRAGEELTLDYRVDATAVKVACRCGAKNCRGTINLTRARRPKSRARSKR